MSIAQQIEELNRAAAAQTEIYDRLTSLTRELVSALAVNNPSLIAAKAEEGEALTTKLRSGQYSLMTKLVQYATACRSGQVEAHAEPPLAEARGQLRACINRLIESARAFSAEQRAAAPLIANGLAFNGTLLEYVMPQQPGYAASGMAQYQRYSNIA